MTITGGEKKRARTCRGKAKPYTLAHIRKIRAKPTEETSRGHNFKKDIKITLWVGENRQNCPGQKFKRGKTGTRWVGWCKGV